ncbi:MAG: hypothetical protein ACRCZR_09655 [Cetobacterium sp.]
MSFFMAPLKPIIGVLITLIPTIVEKVKSLFSKKSKDISEEDINSTNGVLNITEELQNFNSTIEGEMSKIQDVVTKKIEEQLAQYIKISSTLETYPGVKKSTIRRIESEIKRYENSLVDFLLIQLKRNMTIDNNYLLKILKMEKSATKERMIQEFMSKSTKDALSTYSDKISKDLKEISDNIFEEFEYIISELEEQKSLEIENLEKIENLKENSKEKEIIICENIFKKIILENIVRGN